MTQTDWPACWRGLAALGSKCKLASSFICPPLLPCPILAGANDVANAFATAVGSKALTLRQACALAAVFEFAGAMTLGGAVADTVRGKIADLSKFQREPEIYMFGMFCALISAGTWLMISCYTEIPVSTTHSIGKSALAAAALLVATPLHARRAAALSASQLTARPPTRGCSL